MAIETGNYIAWPSGVSCETPCGEAPDDRILVFDDVTGMSSIVTVNKTPAMLHVMRNGQNSTLSIERVYGEGPGSFFAPLVVADRQLRFSGALGGPVAGGAAVVLALSGRYRVAAERYKCGRDDLVVVATPLLVDGDYLRYGVA